MVCKSKQNKEILLLVYTYNNMIENSKPKEKNIYTALVPI